MDDVSKFKHVHFHEYCENCVYFAAKSTEEPCDTCLGIPVSNNSHKPVNFKRKGE